MLLLCAEPGDLDAVPDDLAHVVEDVLVAQAEKTHYFLEELFDQRRVLVRDAVVLRQDFLVGGDQQPRRLQVLRRNGGLRVVLAHASAALGAALGLEVGLEADDHFGGVWSGYPA